MAKPSRIKPLGRPARAGNYDAREHLLDVATRLFAERGVANTTLAKIATTGGVTSAMVHYWFQNRDRLLDAVMEERIAGAFHAVWDSFNPADDAPGTQTEGIVHRMFAVTEKMPWVVTGGADTARAERQSALLRPGSRARILGKWSIRADSVRWLQQRRSCDGELYFESVRVHAAGHL